MIDTIKARKSQWLGHSLRHDSHIQVVLEGIMPGKKGRGQPRTNFTSHMAEVVNWL